MDESNKRKVLAFGGVLLAVLVVIVIVAVVMLQSDSTPHSGAAPYAVTHSFGDDPTTQVNFCWLTAENSAVSIVRYTECAEGTEPDFGGSNVVSREGYIENVTLSIPVAGQEYESTPELQDVERIRHRVYLSDLKPNTRYAYCVGDGSVWSDNGFFTTAPAERVTATDGFSFLITTDQQGFTHSDYEVWSAVLQRALDKHPDVSFMAALGDMVEVQRNSLLWQYALTMPKGALMNLSVAPLAGNKDDKFVFQYFTLGTPADAISFGGYYSFDYRGVHFTVLNTGDGDEQLSSRQLQWLRADLSSEEAVNAVCRIVMIHKAPYSDKNHADDTEIVAIRGQVLPIFEMYGVDVVLEGHDHYYFRSEPVSDSGSVVSPYVMSDVSRLGETVHMYSAEQAASDVSASGLAPIYFMPGSSGVKQHNNSFRDMPEIHAAVSQNIASPTYAYCTVNAEEICFYTYAVDRYRQTVSLVEAWGIDFK